MTRKPLAFLAVLAACGGSPSTPDAAQAADASGFPATCAGSCRTTSVTAALAMTRQLDHAYYGITTSGTSKSLHVEAYRGGGAGCPTQTSPTTDYTLVLGMVPVPSSTAPVSSPGNILDFVGDLLGGPLGAAATMVSITPVAASELEGFVALDVSMTFSAGMVTGHVFATHCAELDAP